VEIYTLISDRFRKLRWKLTLSYTGVTVVALLAVEFILYIVAIGGLTALINSGYLPSVIIDATITVYTPELQRYLSESPHDLEAIAGWLERIRPAPNLVGFSIQETDGLFVIGSDGKLLAISPSDYVENSVIGDPLDPEAIPGLAGPLQAALAGEENTSRLYSPTNVDSNVVMATPVWDAAHEQVLGALVMSVEAPTIASVLGDLAQILGISLVLSIVVAGLAGMAFGSLAARGLVRRFNRLAEATLAWSEGDFTVFVDDSSGDELGQLAQRLNHMARQLEHLLDTRRELAVVQERNRLSRDLHDSVKQQSFAAAAQISAAKTLLKRNPEAAETHIQEAERLTYDLRQELTHLIQELRPAALEGKGLARAVQAYAADWSRQNGIPLDVRVQGERTLSLKVEQAVYRIVQEALSNVARHSQASSVEIGLVYTALDMTCTITDDGIGFDPGKKRGGFGLRSMQERANALGGTLEIESAAGTGTRISLAVSLGKLPESEEIRFE
jgi:NarL family two-component system sensor histidine kinase LiaS